MTAFKLDADQERAVYHEGNLVIPAVPGSGKTAVLVHRVQRLVDEGVNPGRIACLTFLKKAQQALRERLDDLCGSEVAKALDTRTYHSIGASILRNHGDFLSPGFSRAALIKESDLMHRFRRQLKESADTLGVKNLIYPDRETNKTAVTPKIFQRFCSTAYDLLMDIETLDARDPQLKPQLAESGFHVEKHMALVLMVRALKALDKNKLQARWMTFDDMIQKAVRVAMFEPSVAAELAAQYDHVLVDEYQDTSPAQQVLVEMLSINAQLVMVADDDQCQPPGTMVRVSTSDASVHEVPIEDLDPKRHLLPTFETKAGKLVGLTEKAGRKFKKARRPFNGVLQFISTAESSSACTPEHKWLVKWSQLAKDPSTHVVYLMRKGERFRVGWCRLMRSDGVLHLGHRARIEKADSAWIIAVTHDRTDASVTEAFYSTKYGIPTITFEPVNGAKHLTREAIDDLFTRLGPATMHGASRLLGHLRLRMDRPLWTQEGATRRRHGKTHMVMHACNLRADLFDVPVPDDKNKVHWSTITSITTKLYIGDVYSLAVEKDENYVADGLVTHNCIYSWRRANPNLFIDATKSPRFEVIKLQRNYRSGQVILDHADRLIANNTNRIPKTLNGVRQGGTVKSLEFETTIDEARYILKECKRINKEVQTPYEEMMVLVRTNSQLGPLSEAFTVAKVPHHVPASTKSFADLPEVLDLEAYLRLTTGEKPDRLKDAFARIYNRPHRMLNLQWLHELESRSTFEDLPTLAKDVDRMPTIGQWAWLEDQGRGELSYLLRSMSRATKPRTAELLRIVLESSDYENWASGDGDEQDNFRIDNVDKVLQMGDRYPEPLEFLSLLDKMRRSGRQRGQKTEGVTLSTVHRAKGLEADIVFVAGCKPGYMPHALCEDSLEEERRICYVAVTRARKLVVLTRDMISASNCPVELLDEDFAKEMGVECQQAVAPS